MLQFLKNLALALLPVPSRDATEAEQVFQWRQMVAISIIFLGGIQMLFIAIATGYLSFAGLNGFAMATDVQSLIKQGNDLRVTQIENSLQTNRTRQCQAIMEGNRAAMDYAYRALQKDLDDYVAARNFSPRIPSCDELIPSSSGGIQAPTPTPSQRPSGAALSSATHS